MGSAVVLESFKQLCIKAVGTLDRLGLLGTLG